MQLICACATNDGSRAGRSRRRRWPARMRSIWLGSAPLWPRGPQIRRRVAVGSTRMRRPGSELISSELECKAPARASPAVGTGGRSPSQVGILTSRSWYPKHYVIPVLIRKYPYWDTRPGGPSVRASCFTELVRAGISSLEPARGEPAHWHTCCSRQIARARL